ncbi:hypothetical protein [Mycobacterium sp. 23]|uniref:hypothetical protein n=1 Tax=Mycobacterium sp. 23 TaxID=3400424 RepID=UPI003AAD9349
MTESSEMYSEFAVFVEGVGAVVGAVSAPISPIISPAVGPDKPTVFDRRDDAEHLARRICTDYERMGMPQMARKVRVFVRTVTVTRGGWLFAATDGASR